MNVGLVVGTTGTNAEVISQIAGIRESGAFTATIVAGGAIEITNRQTVYGTIDILRTHFNLDAENTYTIRVRGTTGAGSVSLTAVGDPSVSLGETSGGTFDLQVTVTSVELRHQMFGRGIRLSTGGSTADMTIQEIRVTRQ